MYRLGGRLILPADRIIDDPATELFTAVVKQAQKDARRNNVEARLFLCWCQAEFEERLDNHAKTTWR